MLYAIVLLGLIVFASSSNAYHFQFGKNNYNNYITKVCIGNKDRCYPFKISTVTNEFIMFSNKLITGGYNPDESEGVVLGNTTAVIMYNSDYYAGRYAFDNFFLKEDDIYLPFVKFILADQKSTVNENYFGILGVYIGITNTENPNTILKMMIEQNYITKQLITFGHHELEFGDDSIFEHNSKEEIKHCIIKDKKSMFALESCESNGVFYVSKKRHKLRNNETIFFDEAIRDRDRSNF